VLVPSVFAWPRVYVKTAEPWIPVVRYPARGVGALWEPDHAPHELAAVLGRTRARLLALLETPSTTNQLARALHAAPGGISAHLSRLVTAGLASKVRVGREVYYARTARGDRLVT
jgi:DNA-binding transcriptional ArsR family regulator